MLKYNIKNVNATFASRPENFKRDVLRNSLFHDIEQRTIKVTILSYDDNTDLFTIDDSDFTIVFPDSCNSSITDEPVLPEIPKDNISPRKRKSRKKTF